MGSLAERVTRKIVRTKPFPGAKERVRMDKAWADIEAEHGTEILSKLADELVQNGQKDAVVIKSKILGDAKLELRWDLKNIGLTTDVSNGICLETSGNYPIKVRYTGGNGWGYIDFPNNMSFRDEGIYKLHLKGGGKKIEEMNMEEKLRLGQKMATPQGDYRKDRGHTVVYRGKQNG